MKRIAPIVSVAVFGLASLSCMAVNHMFFGEPPTLTVVPPTPVPTLTSTPTPVPTQTAVPTLSPTPDWCPNGDCITGCVEKLPGFSQDGAIAGAIKGAHRSYTDDEEHTLVRYRVDGDIIKNPIEEYGLSESLKDYQKDSRTQERIWNYFISIIPFEQRKFLNAYIIFTDGKENLLAAVAQSNRSPNEWDLSVDIADAADPQDLTFTLIHEFGHLLTLNPAQVVPSQEIFDHPDNRRIYNEEKNACKTYFPGEGCSKPEAYINGFFEQFWPYIYDEWSKIDSIDDEDAYYDALDTFYQLHEDQFVTDYAPTSPAEDIAESFSSFILKSKPTGDSIADQKVLFFYDYPELVQLRSQIGHRLCDQLKK
jgi:hypothetical protein